VHICAIPMVREQLSWDKTSMTPSSIVQAVRDGLSSMPDSSCLENVGERDNLFDAGLTSLSMIELLVILEERFNIRISDDKLNRDIFSSIERLADFVTRELEGGTP
jgi:acyl carrier protein